MTEETVNMIERFGYTGAIIIVVIFIGFKYVPRLIENAIKKSEKKDYREELYLEAIRNNTQVIQNNTAVVKAYTDNAHKLEQFISTLISDFKIHDNRAEGMASDIKVLMERKK